MKKVLVLLIMALTSQLFAADLFLTKENYWFDPNDATLVDASLEVKDLKFAEVDQILKVYLSPHLYKKLKIDRNVSAGMSLLQVSINQVDHSELMQIKKILPQFVRFGAHSLGPEIPLAIRVRNLKGHDDFVSAVSGIPIRTIQEIDQAVERNKSSGKPLIIRYYLDDREKEDPEDFHELSKSYGDAIVTHIPANTFGQMPLVVPGESVVFHSRSFHGGSILGTLNPGLVNSHIAQALTANKYIEALFWKQYAPEALPETHLLSNMGLNLGNPSELVKQLNKRFPEGWVMKGVNESSSNFSIITDKTKLSVEIEAYRRSDFEKFKNETYRKMSGYDEDNIYEALQEHKNYFGWRASQYLSRPDHVIIQKKAEIVKEFRVESIGGRILHGASIDRHNWWLEMKNLPFEVSSMVEVNKVERFAQSIIDKLPADLKETNFAFDIALLKDGTCIAIESNAGSESGFLTNQDTSVEALNMLLRKYPNMKSRGEVDAQGLSTQEQMKYLSDRFQAWGIDIKAQYPNYEFSPTGLRTDFKPIEIPKTFQLQSLVKMCGHVHRN